MQQKVTHKKILNSDNWGLKTFSPSVSWHSVKRILKCGFILFIRNNNQIQLPRDSIIAIPKSRVCAYQSPCR